MPVAPDNFHQAYPSRGRGCLEYITRVEPLRKGEQVDAIRYYVAVIVLVSLPPAVLLWFAIHPLARFWRRLGPVATYGVLALPGLALMALMVAFRTPLLMADLGTSYPLIVLGLVFVGGACAIGVKRKKYLTFAVLSGIPELSRTTSGKLLTEGIYGRMRHPRYVEVVLATLAYALVANYLGLYLIAAWFIGAIYLVILLEERELRERFGKDYEEYCRRVPRFIPRRVPRT